MGESPVSLTVDEVKRIATQAARDTSPTLEVAGVVFGAGAGNYVEILLTIKGCETPPCVVELGAFRDASEATFREEISRKLRDHLNRYGPPQSALG